MIGGIEETSASFEARSAPRSYPTTLGQTEKNSVRANVFRVTPESGHCSIQSACRKRAKAQSRCAPARCAGARAERLVADGEDGDSGVASINSRIVGVQRMIKKSRII